MGGSNDHKNLCIIPDHVNSLKSEFVEAQLRINPEAEKIVTFAPRNGVRVPNVVVGFRGFIKNIKNPSKRKRETVKRQKEFLGIK